MKSSALFITFLVSWFAIAIIGGAEGWFAHISGRPPLALGAFVVIPLAILCVSLARRGWAEQALAGLSLTTLALLHLWRFVGIDFLVTWHAGQLPAGFALPAGVGDVLTALGCLPVALLVAWRAPAARTAWISWNVFGLVDLVVAIASGVTHGGGPIGALTDPRIGTALMTELPRSVIPTFFVPLFIFLHIAMLRRTGEIVPARPEELFEVT